MDILLIVMVCFGWVFWCSRKTFIDIHDMRSRYYRTMTDVDVPREVYERLIKEETRSRLEQHIWYRVTFRDWKKLYPIYFDYFKEEI